ncbi:hypothetical protein [Pseudomonas prosekii]|uniref:hypothetical protein n=1 Tax=Pseudomonas prosekii TaxID=1148509 RepID=UPI00387B22D1
MYEKAAVIAGKRNRKSMKFPIWVKPVSEHFDIFLRGYTEFAPVAYRAGSICLASVERSPDIRQQNVELKWASFDAALRDGTYTKDWSR